MGLWIEGQLQERRGGGEIVTVGWQRFSSLIIPGIVLRLRSLSWLIAFCRRNDDKSCFLTVPESRSYACSSFGVLSICSDKCLFHQKRVILRT